MVSYKSVIRLGLLILEMTGSEIVVCRGLRHRRRRGVVLTTKIDNKMY